MSNFRSIRSMLPKHEADEKILQVYHATLPYIYSYLGTNLHVYEISTIILQAVGVFSFDQSEINELLDSFIAPKERFLQLCQLIESRRILNGDVSVTETFLNFLLNLDELIHVSNAIHGFIEQNLVLLLVAKQYVP